MRFAKGHGTQNDFVVVLDPDGHHGLTGALAARLCDRRAGIGGDGVLRVVRSAAAGEDTPAEWFMDYRNSDGSLAEMCGNGIRVFARYLAETGLVTEPQFTVATRSGPRRVTLEPGGDVTAETGAVAVLGTGHARVGGVPCEGLRILVGNPHLACLTSQPLAGFDLAQPPELDPAEFPDGGNVELVRAAGPDAVAMRVHERGSGETRSCGTGAVAAAMAAASAQGDRDGTWQVTVPGGQLRVRLAGGRSWLTGPAVIVAHGELDPEWLKAADAG
jgi:diaminopimelate epimerase